MGTHEVKERSLGKSGVRLSEIALGTWGLAAGAYGPVEPERFEQLVERALELGVTTFDMAPVWGPDGESERVVGRVVGARRDRARYVTRAGVRWEGGALARAFDPASLRGDVEGSLRRLRTEHVDVLLLHDPPETLWDREHEVKELIERLRTEGKLRAWGVTTGDLDRARMAIAGGAEAVCLVYNLLRGDDLHDLSGALATEGCGVIARSPLLHGLLAGRWAEQRTFSELDHRRDRWRADALRERVRQVSQLRFLVHDEARSLAEAAIRFVLSNSVVTSAAVGARTVAQLAQAAECAVEPPYLPDDDLARLPQILASLGL